MTISLAQLILAGRGEDMEGWTNILFIVVLALFWVISGIVKATTKKPQGRQREPSSGKPPRRPAPPKARPPSAGRPSPVGAPQRSRVDKQAVRVGAGKPRSRLERLASEFDKALGPYVSEAPPKPKTPIGSTAPEPVDLPDNVLVDRAHAYPQTPKETPESERLPELVLDYTNPDELTKAILYYEILGPPMSLRDLSHEIGNP